MKSAIKPSFLITALYSLLSTQALAQAPEEQTVKEPMISFSAFIDVFYCYDFSTPSSSYRQPFLYNHNRHNEFNLNLGLIRANVEHEQYRGAIGLQAGTYPQDNYAEEPELLKHIFEAYAGIALHKRYNIWLDAGIFSSHIGFESAISADNPTPTRSLAAENSPYFLSGAKLSFSPNDRLSFLLLAINGWQKIQRLPGSGMSFGTQIQYRKEKAYTLNWSTYIGEESALYSTPHRYFNNFYAQLALSEKIDLTAGFDIGFQETPNSKNYSSWYSAVMIVRHSFNSRWTAAFRAEYYSDRNGVIIPHNNEGTFFGREAFESGGFSANVDYSPHPKVLWRLEGRWFTSPNEIFSERNFLNGKNNQFITSTLSIRIDK